MKSGKISNTALKRSVLKRIKKRGDLLEAKPSVGADCATLSCENMSQVLLTTTQGRWAVYSAVNNIAVKHGKIASVQCGITVPVKAGEPLIKEIVSELERQCETVGIPISGGHTQVSKMVLAPVVSVTGVGFIPEKNTVKKASVNQDIVAVGCIGVSGIRAIVQMKQEEIRERYTQDVIDLAIGSEEELIGAKAAEIGYELGATYMHDVSVGGIWTALWDMAEYCKLGFDVDLKAIPVRQEIIELCELFGVNPYELESVGGVLMTSDHGARLVEVLRENGMKAACIGRMTEGNQKLVRNGEEVRYLDSPHSDELEQFV